MTGEVEKAAFDIYETRDAKKPAKSFKVLFNPSSYSIKEEAEYTTPSKGNGTTMKNEQVNYTGNKSRILSLELFFDTSEKVILNGQGKNVVKNQAADVSKVTKNFSDMVHVKGKGHTPPSVEFRWGSLHFRGVVSDISTEYLMFTKEGKPIRAKMSLSIKSISENDDIFKEPFESPDRTKALKVTEARSIWDIAAEEYGSPDMWRIICAGNDIENPLDIPSGRTLKIPALD